MQYERDIGDITNNIQLSIISDLGRTVGIITLKFPTKNSMIDDWIHG